MYVKFEEDDRTQTLFLGIEDLPAQDATTIFQTLEQYLAERLLTEMFKRCTNITCQLELMVCLYDRAQQRGHSKVQTTQSPRILAVW